MEWTRSDSKNLHGFLHNLGVGLREAYMRSCDLNDLAEAIRVFQQSVQRTPADAPDLAYHLMGLGVSLSDRFERIGDPVDLEEARTCYRLACLRGQDVAPGEVLGNARNWVNWALERNAWIEAIEAYDFGRQAVELLFASQNNRRNKELWLGEAQGLPANGAYALAKLGQP